MLLLRRPEQLIEEITEPGFEHVELRFADRNAVGPIVCNDPTLDRMLDGPSDPRPRSGNDIEVVWWRAAFGATTTQ